MSKNLVDPYISKAAGQLLIDYSVNQGVSMAEIAARGIIQSPVLSQIKNQRRNITPDLVMRLARSMDKSVEEFYMELMRIALRIQEEDLLQEQTVYFAGPAYADGIIALMDTLSEGDTYWLISIERPIEFDNDLLDHVVLNCISKGARINYVFPALKYDDLMSEEKEVEEDQEEMNYVLAEYGQVDLDKHFWLWRKRFGQRNPSYKEVIRRNVHCYNASLEGYIWFAPFVKYILIERGKGTETSPAEAWLDVAYYDPGETGVVNYGQKRCALPLNPKVVRSLRRWCSQSLELVSGTSDIST